MGVRIDKYLWAVRIFKTRSIATEACRGNRISIDNTSVKPSREVKIGDIISIQKERMKMTIKVINIAEKRMGAPLVKDFMEDLTPAEEYDKNKLIGSGNFESRDRGIGRPTKRDRRNIDLFKYN